MTCKRIKVGIDVCHLEFGDGHTADTETFRTCRGELMVLRLDSIGCVIDIELISDTKPCMMEISKQTSLK